MDMRLAPNKESLLQRIDRMAVARKSRQEHQEGCHPPADRKAVPTGSERSSVQPTLRPAGFGSP